jgi:hypothetical protein
MQGLRVVMRQLVFLGIFSVVKSSQLNDRLKTLKLSVWIVADARSGCISGVEKIQYSQIEYNRQMPQVLHLRNWWTKTPTGTAVQPRFSLDHLCQWLLSCILLGPAWLIGTSVSFKAGAIL